MQMPVMPRCWHVAPVGQPPKKQVNAQYLSPELESWSTQFGLAVVPAGTSVGQGKSHNGERKPRPLHLALARPLHRSGKEASRSDLYLVVQAMEAMEAMEVTEAMGALACQTQRDTRADLTEVHIR